VLAQAGQAEELLGTEEILQCLLVHHVDGHLVGGKDLVELAVVGQARQAVYQLLASVRTQLSGPWMAAQRVSYQLGVAMVHAGSIRPIGVEGQRG